MAISPKPTYGESEGRTATEAFRKRDLPTDQAQAQQNRNGTCLSGDVQVSAIRQLLGEAAV
jgi:hypothetical protein